MATQLKDSGITWHPKAGQILICDFKGNIEPEITKKRPVVIFCPRLLYRTGLCTVVPLSTTPPKYDVPYVVKLSQNYLSNQDEDLGTYAKCDLVCSVSLARLDRIKIGYRKFISPQINSSDFEAIKAAVKHALCLENSET